MASTDLSWNTDFIWGIADDVLRDVYVPCKYRDVILPMIVIRCLDALLEKKKQAALTMKERLDQAGIENRRSNLLGRCPTLSLLISSDWFRKREEWYSAPKLLSQKDSFSKK